MPADTSGELGDVLGIWGHPDDEAWLSSGLMMRAVAAGQRVACVTATHGEAGFPPDDPRSESERRAVRRAELARCLEILGVSEHRYLGYADGGCVDVPDADAIAALVDIIVAMRPDSVLTFGPDGATGHPDHIAVCRWTTQAVRLAGLPGTQLLYATRTQRWTDALYAGVDPSTVIVVKDLVPEIVDESELTVWFRCDDDMVARKVAAMRAQASQLEPLAQAMGLEAFGSLVREEFYRAPLPSDDVLIERMRHIRLT